ncbi:MAG: mannose-1-phosphate guanylyltransferase/mannose-6-phosphate isomerase [Albidovulum sp.]|nr:mannose-1-phosphate guanylyltransferase/mannose-6-phosphate isomerase [Albidovulum sp.]
MSNISIWPLILAGGTGERLWPVSRKSLPKQFQALNSELSLFQECALRLAEASNRPPIVLCNNRHRFIAAEHLRLAGIEPGAIILEPARRNTAPAIAVAASWVRDSDPDAVVVAAPADHVVESGAAFRDAIEEAVAYASRGYIVAIGIEPTRPSEGFGYIRQGEKLEGGRTARKIEKFVEKPDRETAEKFLREGNYWWNAGIFVFSASAILRELETSHPQIADGAKRAVSAAEPDLDFLRLNEAAFNECPSTSIDYAVMEHTGRGVAVRLDAEWFDIGSWSGALEASPKNSDGSVAKGNVYLDNVRQSYIRSDGTLVAVKDLENVAVVATRDAVLVCDLSKSQDIRSIVRGLGESGRTEGENHAKDYRPWGNFEVIDEGARFLVKRLQIDPGASISLQKHRHRAEHWVVVQGRVQVTRDDDILELSIDQSVYIPQGAVHRISNPGDVPALIVEVQTGEHLSEDDIVRFEDKYRRA